VSPSPQPSTDDVIDPEEKQFELKISKAILSMPPEVQDRFKALKTLQVRNREVTAG